MPRAPQRRRGVASASSPMTSPSSRRRANKRQVDPPAGHAPNLAPTPPAANSPALDSTMFPHIIESIVSFMPHESLVAMRAVSRDMRDKCDALISQHLVFYCPKDAPRDWMSGYALSPALATPDGRIPLTYFISQLNTNATTTDANESLTRDMKANPRYSTFSRSMPTTHMVDVVGPMYPGHATFTRVMYNTPHSAIVRIMPDRWRHFGYVFRAGCAKDTVIVFNRLTWPAGSNIWGRRDDDYKSRGPMGFTGMRLLVHTYLFQPRGDMEQPMWTRLWSLRDDRTLQELVVHFYREGPQNRYRLRATDTIVDSDPLRDGLPHVAGVFSYVLAGVAETLYYFPTITVTIVNVAVVDPECFFMRPEASDEEMCREVDNVILAITGQTANDNERDEVVASARERLHILTVDEYVASVGAERYARETDVRYTYELEKKKKRKTRRSGAAVAR